MYQVRAQDVPAPWAPPIQPHPLSWVLFTDQVLVCDIATLVELEVIGLLANNQLVEYKKCLKNILGGGLRCICILNPTRRAPSVRPHLLSPIHWVPLLSGLSSMICCCWGSWGFMASAAAARAGVFAILINKFRKIMKIFQRLDHARSWWTLCQI